MVAALAGLLTDRARTRQELLQLRDDRATGFELLATYSPFNFCQAGAADIDLGSSGTTIVDLPAGESATPHLLAVGG